MFEDTASDDDTESTLDNFSIKEAHANINETVSRPAQLISELPTLDG